MRFVFTTTTILCVLFAVGCDKKASDAPAAASDKAGAAPSAPPPVTGKPIPITVGEDGFAPNEVKVAKGEQTTLVFTRTTDKTCAKDVDFPELKITKALPLNQPVAVVVPSGEARTLTFQCGMGMYKSKVVVQ
jgi:plastocyanin domain-containing protein